MGFRRLASLTIAVVLVAASGANCPQVLQQYTQPLPRALPAAATLAQIVDVVNDNSRRIQSFSTSRASISTPGFPALRANIAFQQPRSFRLRADTALTGPEVDLGSNEELFWFWIRRNQPPALFFCRHDRFAMSAARQMIPIEPEWLIEALGVVTFDPADQHQGPFPVRDGRVEIRTVKAGSQGGPTRIAIVDDSRGIVLEQHMYDSQGQRISSAVLSRHMRDPATGVVLPRHVRIEWPPAKFELTIEIASLQVNRLDADPQALFTKPQYPGYNDVDLGDPTVRPFGAPAATAQMPRSPAAYAPYPAAGQGAVAAPRAASRSAYFRGAAEALSVPNGSRPLPFSGR